MDYENIFNPSMLSAAVKEFYGKPPQHPFTDKIVTMKDHGKKEEPSSKPARKWATSLDAKVDTIYL